MYSLDGGEELSTTNKFNYVIVYSRETQFLVSQLFCSTSLLANNFFLQT